MPHRFCYLLIALITLAWPLHAMGQPTSDAERLRIVILGSSTAEGAGPSDVNNAWVNRYRAYCREAVDGCEVINLARGGYTTYHILPTGMTTPAERPKPDTGRNITEALALRPDAIIINLPSNDAASGFSVEEQVANYRAILDAAPDVPIWTTTTQPRNLPDDQRQTLIAMRDSTYTLFGDWAIDFWTEIALAGGRINPDYDSGDAVHLNDEAHRLLFERVRDAGVLEAALERAATSPE